MKLLKSDGKKTLRSLCHQQDQNGNSMQSQCKRIAAVWNELDINKQFLSKQALPTDPSLLQVLEDKFPTLTVEHGKGRRRSDGKNVMRTNEQWKEILMNLYVFLSGDQAREPKPTVRSCCLAVLKNETICRRIAAVWSELKLDEDVRNKVSPFDISTSEKLERKCPAETVVGAVTDGGKSAGRDLSVSSNSYFDVDEEAFFCEALGGFARAGFPLEKPNVKAWADAFLRAEGLDTGNAGISMDTVERTHKEGQLKAKSNVNPVDPKRAAQADPLVLNSFYHVLDAAIGMAHEVNPTAWPEERCADAPPLRIFNSDEQGPNPTHLRNSVIIPADVFDLPRLFQNTREGDGKMQFHCTVANIVRADGAQCHPHESVEGAPAPHILISDKGSAHELDSLEKGERDRRLANQSEENDIIKISTGVLEGWFDNFQPGKNANIVNKFGFQIRTTPTGSMLKRTFYDFMLHFIKQLPHDQGKNGLGVALFLDWHSSRECPQTLILSFFEHNVLTFVLPSKTSIWSQPCDNGKNELTCKDIATAAHDQNLLAGNTLDYRDANRTFRAGLEKNCLDQNNELRRTGTNAVVSSFRKTGLCPMDYDNEGWNLAIRNFNKLNELLRQQRIESGERVPTTNWVVKPKPIAERSALTEEEIQIQRKRSEVAAMKLMRFEAVNNDNRVDTTCRRAPADIALDKLRTKLSLVKFGHAIVLRSKESGETLNLMKQNARQFVVGDKAKRESRNMVPMNVAQTLDECYDAEDDAAYSLTKKDKKKQQKKKRIERKKLNAQTYAEAQAIADDQRRERNVNKIRTALGSKRPRFMSNLKELLEEEGMSMVDLCAEFEDVVLDPFSVVAPVKQGDTTKEISITRVGSNTSAVSHSMEQTLINLVLKMKAQKGGGNPKRKRRRGAGQSTHLGKSGVAVAILTQRQNKDEEIKALFKEEEKKQDEATKLRSLISMVTELIKEKPTSFWKDDQKGWKREALLRLFGVYRSNMKAEQANYCLKELKLTKAKVKAALADKKVELKSKEDSLPPIIAERREAEDFLDATQECANDDCNKEKELQENCGSDSEEE